MEQKQYAPEYAIWIKTDKNGNEFLSMKTPDGQWFNFFKNKNKKSDKAPDWTQAKNNTSYPKKESNDFSGFGTGENVPF